MGDIAMAAFTEGKKACHIKKAFSPAA